MPVSDETRRLNKAVLLIVLGTFWFALMSALGKLLTRDLHPLQVVFFRNAGALCFSLPFLPAIGRYLWQSERKMVFLVRGAISQTATSFWFLAVAHAPFIQVNALSFVTPAASTAMAMLFLKEEVRKLRWLGLALGMVGVLWILRPGFASWYPGYHYAMGSVCCWAVVNVAIKSLATTEPPMAIVFAMFLVMTCLSLPGAWWVWKPISSQWFSTILALGFTAFLWQASITFAYRYGSVSEVQPFEYTRLIFSSLLASLLFLEPVDSHIVGGTAIILASAFVGIRKLKAD